MNAEYHDSQDYFEPDFCPMLEPEQYSFLFPEEEALLRRGRLSFTVASPAAEGGVQ